MSSTVGTGRGMFMSLTVRSGRDISILTVGSGRNMSMSLTVGSGRTCLCL